MKEKISLQTIFSFVSMVCMIVIMCTVLVLYKNMTNNLNKLQNDAQAAITTIQTVANDIEEANLPGIAENINTLTENATEDLADTMEKVNSIDIDALNSSIDRLDRATESFENAVNGFRNFIPGF